MSNVEVDFIGDLRAFGSFCRLYTEECNDGHHDKSKSMATKHSGLG